MNRTLRTLARFRVNLNWVFDPRTAWHRREPLRLPKHGADMPPSEIARLFADWTAARDHVNATGGDDAEAVADLMAIETAMFALPATTPADLAMKLFAFGTGDVVHPCEHSQPLCAEIERLVGRRQG